MFSAVEGKQVTPGGKHNANVKSSGDQLKGRVTTRAQYRCQILNIYPANPRTRVGVRRYAGPTFPFTSL